MFFAKDQVKTEILNDINNDLTTLFRVLSNHLEEFLRYFKWTLCSRDEFDRLNSQNPDSLTDIQRASRFYYLQKLCFGGRPIGRTFGTSTTSAPRLNLLRIEEELSQVHLRLSRVTIENRPWQRIIEQYDRKHSLFYLDPPYFGCEDYYGKEVFNREDYDKMTEILANLEGAFILSLNDKPEVREIFRDFYMKKVSVQYNLNPSDKKRIKYPELIISSMDLNNLIHVENRSCP